MTEAKHSLPLNSPLPEAREIPRSEIDGFLGAAPMMLSMAAPDAPPELVNKVSSLANGANAVQVIVNGECIVNLRITD